jgi:hypothetical protein
MAQPPVRLRECRIPPEAARPGRMRCCGLGSAHGRSPAQSRVRGVATGEFAALVWDDRWRVVAVTDELLTILGGGVERPDPPLGAHVFSAEWVEFQASRPGGPIFESQREVFGAMVGALLGGHLRQ